MGLITTTVEVQWQSRNKRHYESKGYKFTQINDNFSCKIEDLSKGSHVKVQVKCDGCNNFINVNWKNYLRYLQKDNKYYCVKCSHKLFGKEKLKQTKLKNSKSFYDWCYDNLDKTKADEIIDRWDTELNQCSPKDVCHSSAGFNQKGYWFKCLKHLEHKPELHNIVDFVNNIQSKKYIKVNSLDCKQCNSFAQWGIDNIDEDFLEKYWDYEKNKDIDPWKINKCCNKKVWIKCQEKKYHGSYNACCSSFISGKRCPYCVSKKVHPKDSLGQYIIDNYEEDFLSKIWSDKNKKSSFEYSLHNNKKVWCKCLNGKHKDYCRSVETSTRYNFRCPNCEGFSKGEEKIDNYLISNKIINEPQKTFEGLLGLGNGLLSYDFYLPKYNLLIEYQGEQHERYIKGMQKSKKDFEKQLEHDRRKREYAKKHNIKLLEIWYNCFDDVEFILDKVLRELNNKQYNTYINNDIELSI